MTMQGPVAPSMWKLIRVPSTQENTDTIVATISMRSKRRHSIKAMMPGAISMAITGITHGLQRGDDGHRQQAQQPVVQQLDRQANHPRMMRIEAVQHEVFTLEQHHRQGDAGDQQGLLQLAVGNAQHVAEQNVAQVLVGIDAREQHQPKANMPEKTMPITVSSFTRLFSFR